VFQCVVKDLFSSLSQLSHNTSDVPPEYYLTNFTKTSREERERGVGNMQDQM